jgi:hypothetical protein
VGKNKANYNLNYTKNSNSEFKKQKYLYQKKRNQEIIHNNEHSNSFNDNKNNNKLNFINKYKKAEYFSYYDKKFSKFINLNFLKRIWKQKNYREEDNELMIGLGLNIMGQNQSLNNINVSSL